MFQFLPANIPQRSKPFMYHSPETISVSPIYRSFCRYKTFETVREEGRGKVCLPLGRRGSDSKSRFGVTVHQACRGSARSSMFTIETGKHVPRFLLMLHGKRFVNILSIVHWTARPVRSLNPTVPRAGSPYTISAHRMFTL